MEIRALDTVDFAKALADETRQKIMTLCCCRELCVSDIVAALNMDQPSVTQPTVSHHLKILRQAGLVRVTRRGKEVYYTLNQDRLARGCCQVAEDFAPDIHTVVREHYGKAASQKRSSCCTPAVAQSGCCGSIDEATFTPVEKIYENFDVHTLPEEVTNMSLGCGDPITLGSLQPGEVVLDLGSGGGIDCFLAAKKVGPSGRVIGVDMTPEMLERARSNRARLGATNVEFRLGEIEHLPVADETVDVVISNCVINLSPDKPQVFSEAFRVLKSGGRLAVSDIVTDGPLPEAIRHSLSAWAGCVAGAWEAKDYIAAIQKAGFVDVSLRPVYLDRESMAEAAKQLDPTEQMDLDEETYQKAVYSAKVSARKP